MLTLLDHPIAALATRRELLLAQRLHDFLAHKRHTDISVEYDVEAEYSVRHRIGWLQIGGIPIDRATRTVRPMVEIVESYFGSAIG